MSEFWLWFWRPAGELIGFLAVLAAGFALMYAWRFVSGIINAWRNARWDKRKEKP